MADDAHGDFILLCEFSEIQGPVALLTYPNGAGQLFDRNGFVLRVMSVDFQNKAAPTSMPGMAKQDIQMILRDRSQNANAFVHHFTLPDFHARGYSRPVSLSYVTAQADKLVPMFNSLRSEFAKVASLLKTAAQTTFLRDVDEILAELSQLQKMLKRSTSTSKRSQTPTSLSQTPTASSQTPSLVPASAVSPVADTSESADANTPVPATGTRPRTKSKALRLYSNTFDTEITPQTLSEMIEDMHELRARFSDSSHLLPKDNPVTVQPAQPFSQSNSIHFPSLGSSPAHATPPMSLPSGLSLLSSSVPSLQNITSPSNTSSAFLNINSVTLNPAVSSQAASFDSTSNVEPSIPSQQQQQQVQPPRPLRFMYHHTAGQRRQRDLSVLCRAVFPEAMTMLHTIHQMHHADRLTHSLRALYDAEMCANSALTIGDSVALNFQAQRHQHHIPFVFTAAKPTSVDALSSAYSHLSLGSNQGPTTSEAGLHIKFPTPASVDNCCCQCAECSVHKCSHARVDLFDSKQSQQPLSNSTFSPSLPSLPSDQSVSTLNLSESMLRATSAVLLSTLSQHCHAHQPRAPIEINSPAAVDIPVSTPTAKTSKLPTLAVWSQTPARAKAVYQSDELHSVRLRTDVVFPSTWFKSRFSLGLLLQQDWNSKNRSEAAPYGVPIPNIPGIEHLVASLLQGRPVIIYGGPAKQQLVESIVIALSAFVPGKSNFEAIRTWWSPTTKNRIGSNDDDDVGSTLRVRDLARVKLCGVSKELELPKNMHKLISIFDVERNFTCAPAYESTSTLVPNLLKRMFKDAVLFERNLHYALLGMCYQAFLLYQLAFVGAQSHVSLPLPPLSPFPPSLTRAIRSNLGDLYLQHWIAQTKQWPISENIKLNGDCSAQPTQLQSDFSSGLPQLPPASSFPTFAQSTVDWQRADDVKSADSVCILPLHDSKAIPNSSNEVHQLANAELHAVMRRCQHQSLQQNASISSSAVSSSAVSVADSRVSVQLSHGPCAAGRRDMHRSREDDVLKSFNLSPSDALIIRYLASIVQQQQAASLDSCPATQLSLDMRPLVTFTSKSKI